MDKIQNYNYTKCSNNQTGTNDNNSIKQDVDISAFKAFQSKVASEFLCRREVSVIIGMFGGAGAAVGGIFAIEVGVAAMVGALAGLVGAAAAPFVLIGMGALCIAAIIGGVVLFVKNRKENIYIKELNKLLQSDGVANRKQAISYLNEMISKYKECSAEHNAAVRSLNKNTKIFKFCLESEDSKLVDGTIKFLTNVSKDKFEETECAIKSIITYCLNSTNNLTLDRLISANNVSLGNAIKLLTEMLKNKDIQTYVEKNIGSGILPIKDYLASKNDQLEANTIALLSEMLKHENLAGIAKKIITDDKDISVEVNGFAEKMKGRLGSRNDGLKIKTVELLNNMLVGSDEELKSKSREILKSDVLNTKGMLNIFMNGGGNVNEDAISLLKPMCKDGEIKNILSELIGENLVKKLEEQGNDIKSADVVNVLYENAIVEGIFSDENKKHIINILKDVDGLHKAVIDFNDGQITGVKRENLEKFFNREELNLEALKAQSIIDFGRDLKSIKTANGNVINAEGARTNNEEFLEETFKNAKISEDAKNLIYKFPGQSTIGTRALLVDGVASYCGVLTSFKDRMCSKLNSCGITVNTDGSVEVQMRRIGIINACAYNLPMAIEEVHTFKINKGDDRYKTTNAKITVYKLEKTDIQLTEENLKVREKLSQVSYNGDENNN